MPPAQDKDRGQGAPAAAAEDALGSVIGVLLLHPQLGLRARGAAVLREFISKQVGSNS